MRKVFTNIRTLNNTWIAAIITVMVAACLESCCRHHRNDDEIPIAMSVQKSSSKALINNSDNAVRIKQMMRDSYNANGQRTGGFGVHGFKTINQTAKKTFDNMRVYPDISLSVNSKPELEAFPDNTGWTYQPTRYWDRNQAVSYQFLAYWPYLPGEPDAIDATKPYATSTTNQELEADYDNKELTLHNIPNWQTASIGDVVQDTVADYMTANRRGVYASDFSTGTVSFSFNHLLSQLIIKAYYIGVDKTASGGVIVKGFTLHKSGTNDQVLGAGTTDFKQRYEDAKARQVTVADDGQGANIADMVDSYKFFDYSTGISIPYDDELDDVPAAPVVIGSWLFIPHKWQDLVLTVTRKVGTENDGESGPAQITLGSDRDLYKTLAGKTYTVTLMFDTSSDGLTVSPIDVQNWTEQKAIREVHTW